MSERLKRDNEAAEAVFTLRVPLDRADAVEGLLASLLAAMALDGPINLAAAALAAGNDSAAEDAALESGVLGAAVPAVPPPAPAAAPSPYPTPTGAVGISDLSGTSPYADPRYQALRQPSLWGAQPYPYPNAYGMQGLQPAEFAQPVPTAQAPQQIRPMQPLAASPAAGMQSAYPAGAYSSPAPPDNGAAGLTPGAFLRQLRRERGLTQRALADVAQTSQSRISDYESGVRPIPANVAQAISRFFGVPIAGLLD